jgi:hypothetical protein
MATEPVRRVIRLEKAEVSNMPAAWTEAERGQYLRLLLQCKGIDTGRLYRIEYYPDHRCWLVIQESGPGPLAGTPRRETDERFYRQTIAEFRRTARLAFATQAAHSPYFARFGRTYQAPSAAPALSPAEFARQLEVAQASAAPVRFDGEGGWRVEPSEN